MLNIKYFQAGTLYHSIWREQVLLGKGAFAKEWISQHLGLRRNMSQDLLEDVGLSRNISQHAPALLEVENKTVKGRLLILGLGSNGSICGL